MSKLNKDILFLLFGELQDDSKSLFSCLLVNRLWCETVVPILWRNPWHYDIKYQNKSSLFNIVTLSLTNDIKEILISQGVQFTSRIMQKSLLFDYLSFCRSMNINVINDIISVGTYSLDYQRFLLQKEIYNLFMKKCPELKNLDIRSIEHQIFYIPEANARLDSLCELTCDMNSDCTYFYGLACICNNIEKLIVNDVTKGNDGIIKLIEVQRNLKYLEWREEYFDIDNFSDVFYEKLSQALINHAHTLTHLIISAVDDYFVLLDILTKLHKLRTLKLNFNETEGSCEEKLKNAVYSNLETFQLDDCIFIDTVICLIKNSKGHLREILINNYDFVGYDRDNFYKQSLSLICAIYEKCPLVEYLSLAFPFLSKEHFIEFEKLLKACQKLRVLLLYIDGVDGGEFLKVLNKSAPISLREIRFSSYFKISLETLEEFLEDWKEQRRPALTILTFEHHYEKEEYTELINRYKNYNVLKDFRFVSRSEMYF